MSVRSILKDLCSHHLYYEKDISYLLVNIRKCLELTETEDQFPKLKFFCDWALHAHMTRAQAQGIVELADHYEKCRAGSSNDSEPPQELHEFFQFRVFRSELKAFLEGNGFMSYVTTDFFWAQFLGTYALIVAGHPLRCVNRRKTLAHVNTVDLHVRTLNSPFEASQRDGLVLQIEWQWTSLVTGAQTTLLYSYFDSDVL